MTIKWKATFALGLFCIFSPFGWGFTHRPLPQINLILSIIFWLKIESIGIQTITASRDIYTTKWRITLMTVNSIIVIGACTLCVSSSLLQFTSGHHQFITHFIMILIGLAFITFFMAQEIIRGKIERNTPPPQHSDYPSLE